MNDGIFIVFGILAVLAIALLVHFLLSNKKKKKPKSFAYQYIEDVRLRETQLEKVEIEQVSISHFNTASKGLKAHKLDNDRETKLALKINPPKMRR